LSHHLSQVQVERYCLQILPPAELLEVSDHLEECEQCRRQVETRLDDSAFFAIRSEIFGDEAVHSLSPAPAHLTFEKTSQYIDGKLPADKIQELTDHLTRCEECALAVKRLRAFKDDIAPELRQTFRPAITAAWPRKGWRRPGSSRRSFSLTSPSLAFGVSLMVLVLAGTAWLILRTSREEPIRKDESASTTSPPTPAKEPPVPLLAQVNDGEGRIALDTEGRLSGANQLPSAYQQMIKEALTNPRIEPSPLLKGLSRPPSALMSIGKSEVEFSVIGPVGKVLLTDRPTFRWSKLKGTSAYAVEVFDNKLNLIVSSPRLVANSWTISKPLARGVVFAWQVKAFKDGEEITAPRPPSPQAKFRILDKTAADDLTEARQAFSSSHLLMGLLYAREGLLEEAQAEFQSLERKNPNSEIVRKLLERVRSMRR
jgi:hypothetical protein